MKRAPQLILVFMLFVCFTIVAQIDCSLTEFTENDFIAAKQEPNFTAYNKDNDPNVYFIVNEYIRETYAAEDVHWEFAGSDDAVGYEATYESPSPGNLQVTLRIPQNPPLQDIIVTKDSDTFVVSVHGGLKIKHVKDIEWPSGSVQGVHAPFTHRILNGSSNDLDEAKFDYHRAIDIISPLGDDVVAIANGVIHSINNPEEGIKSVRIKHLMDTPLYIHEKVVSNYYTTSGHVENIDPSLRVGDVVCKGTQVSEVGASGLNGYFHNHFTIAVGTANSEAFLDGRPDIRDNEQNEFSRSVDARINPYLFLDNTVNEKNSLRYSVEEEGDRLRVIINSDFLEDHFNEILVRYTMSGGEKKELKLNLSTREGLPSFGNTNNRYDYFNDGDIQDIEQDDIEAGITEYVPDPDIEIFPQNFGRSISGGVTGNNLTGTNRIKDYQITFEFKNFDSFNPDAGDYIRVKDIYGNLGTEINATLINYEDFDSGTYDFWTLSPLDTNNEAIEFDNDAASEPNPRSLGSFKSINLKNHGSITTTNAISVSQYDRLQVKFSYYNPNIDNGYDINDTILVQVSTDNDTTWSTIKDIVYEPSNATFNEKEFWYTYTGYIEDVSNLDDIKIRIIGNNDITNSADRNILIDYVSITGFNNSISDSEPPTDPTEETPITNLIYPNPVENTLFITDIIYKSFVIYNFLGQQVTSGTIPNNTMDVSGLVTNPYILHLIKEDGSATFIKIIKI